MSMAYIRDFYGVPAKRGGIVFYKGHRGVITGSKNAYLRVRMEDFDIIKTFHPNDLVFEDLETFMKEPETELSYDNAIKEIINEQGHTDGGQNPYYEGLFDGETEDNKEKRIQWAMNEDQLPWPGMMTAFERYYGQSWFEKSYRDETAIWAAAWKSAKQSMDK